MGENLHSMVRKRIGKEMKDNNFNWILFNADKNIEPFLFIPIELYPSLQKKAMEAGKDPALIITFKSRYPWAPPKVTYYEKDITLYRCTKYCKIYFKPYYFVGNSLSCVKKCKKIKKGFSKNRKMDILKMSKIDS